MPLPAALQRPVQSFRAGQRVVVKNLTKRPEVNGTEFELLEFDTGTQRWKVATDDGGFMRIREDNLLPSGPPTKTQCVGSDGET